MTTYRYSAPSIIDEISFHKTENDSTRAYIHAREGTPDKQLSEILDALQKRHFVCVPSSQNGQPALEVRGFTHTHQLTDLLRERGDIRGEPAVQKTPQKQQPFTDKIRHHSLLASGAFYAIGDVNFITYGHKNSSPLDMAAGGFYAAGTWANVGFNHKSNADLQVHDLAQQMADYMNRQHFAIPKEASLHCILGDDHKGKLKKTEDFMRRYPAEMMNAFFAMAGVCIALAAHKRIGATIPVAELEEMTQKYVAKQLRGNPKADVAALTAKAHDILPKFRHASHVLDVGLGSLTLASGAFGAIVKERAHDPDAPKKEGMALLWEKMREHPLTVTGIGLMVSTLCHAVSTGIEWKIGTKNAKEAIFDRGVFVATNLIAEALVAISSKGHGEGVVKDKTVDDSVIAIAADLVARHPAGEQEKLVDCMVRFLGSNRVLAIGNAQVREKLQHQVEQMRGNPWSHCTQPSPALQLSQLNSARSFG